MLVASLPGQVMSVARGLRDEAYVGLRLASCDRIVCVSACMRDSSCCTSDVLCPGGWHGAWAERDGRGYRHDFLGECLADLATV